MTCKDIYDAALSLIAESADPADTADYEERAPYLLAAFCAEHYQTDMRVREVMGEQTADEPNSLYLALETQFPLLPRFTAGAALYLAAMLIIDDFPDFSDRLYDRYCDSVSRLYDCLPAVCKQTVNKYFGD